MAGDSAVSSSSENSFDLQVLLEPWPDENGHVQRNRSQETSLRQRVYAFGNGESPFLMGKTGNDFFNDVQESLGSASTQQEYTSLLDFENRDLQIRELQRECCYLFREALEGHPDLLPGSPESFLSFLESQREELEAELTNPDIPPRSVDEMEIYSLSKIAKDLKEKGDTSYYFHKWKRERVSGKETKT